MQRFCDQGRNQPQTSAGGGGGGWPNRPIKRETEHRTTSGSGKFFYLERSALYFMHFRHVKII